FSQQWGLKNTLVPGADVAATLAWDVSLGDPSVVVAVLDSGVDFTHPDLAANLWTNPGEIPGNSLDDDLNGFVDDVRGWDFVDNDNDPGDLDGHGTIVTGVLAAVGNNGVGVSGVAPRVRFMPLRFIGPGGGFTSDAIRALDYSVRMGARISNNSWGGASPSAALQSALQNAHAAGQLTVFAAGNSAWDIDLTPHYPPSHDLEGILSVGAGTIADERSLSSNYGAVGVDLFAPGEDIVSTAPGNAYALATGTSVSAPFASGVAALLLSQRPALSLPELKALILAGVDFVPAFSGLCRTDGRLNARRSLAIAAPARLTGVSPAGGIPGESLTLTGTNFGGTPGSVRFGGLPGTVTSWSDTSIQATLPAGLSPGPVRVRVLTTGAGQTEGLPVFVETDPSLEIRPDTPGFTELSGTGTPLNFGTADSLELALPFPVEFYGIRRTGLRVSRFGCVSFQSDPVGPDPAPLPSTAPPNGLLAPLWSPQSGLQVFLRTVGSAPNRSFLVEWTGAETFELELREGSTEVRFHYAGLNGGAGASVGVESPSGRRGVAWLQRPIADNSSLLVAGPAPPPAPPADVVPVSGTLTFEPGWSQLSFPVERLTALSFTTLSPFRLWVYDADYTVVEGTLAAVNQAGPSRGYWLLATAPVTIAYEGLPAAGPLRLPLRQGWNLVGLPNLEPVDLAALTVRPAGESPLPFRSALSVDIPSHAPGWLFRYLFEWRGSYVHQDAAQDGSRLLPGHAYWIYGWGDTTVEGP
ncbi:MAG: S8 family serine peptidase, partial [Candidatus Eremiobacterota bacterium]